MKSILFTLLTLAQLGTMIAEEQKTKTINYGAKLNAYRAYPDSKQFCFFANIVINETENTAAVTVTSFENTGLQVCQFDEEILEQTKRNIAMWLKNNTTVTSFAMSMKDPNGMEISGNFEVAALADKSYCWYGMFYVN